MSGRDSEVKDKLLIEGKIPERIDKNDGISYTKISEPHWIFSERSRPL